MTSLRTIWWAKGQMIVQRHISLVTRIKTSYTAQLSLAISFPRSSGSRPWGAGIINEQKILFQCLYACFMSSTSNSAGNKLIYNVLRELSTKIQTGTSPSQHLPNGGAWSNILHLHLHLHLHHGQMSITCLVWGTFFKFSKNPTKNSKSGQADTCLGYLSMDCWWSEDSKMDMNIIILRSKNHSPLLSEIQSLYFANRIKIQMNVLQKFIILQYRRLLSHGSRLYSFHPFPLRVTYLYSYSFAGSRASITFP